MHYREGMTARSRGALVAALGVLGAVGLTGCDGDEDGASRGGATGAGGADAGGGDGTGATASGGGESRGGAGVGGDSTTGGSAAAAGESLSERYPEDDGIASDAAVLFFDDFEAGWGRWDEPRADTAHLHLEQDAALAHGGARFLRSTVTFADLDADEYISSSTRADLPERVPQVFVRFYARFVGVAPNPHHWVRVAAGTEAWSSSGLANTVPPGDGGFWFDFDADLDDVFNFYVYWYQMRSGRCNDGTAVPGCEGDQGTTYYYGNVFRPPEQVAFSRDEWLCIELMGKANTVGAADGELAFTVDERPVGEYRPGYPVGTWLRDSFHTGGCDWSACTDPVPFEGFDFRSSDAVRFKQIFLDAYYERGSSASKRAELEARGLTVSDEQTILYDDVVVATERVGCKVTR